MKVNIKGNLQARALATLQHYLDDHPAEARALCESVFLDLCRKLTITETEQWIDELQRMHELSISWEAETEAE